MKVAAVAALCAAPLAFAGSLDMNLRSRGLLEDRNSIVLGSTETSEIGQGKKSHDSSKDSQQAKNNNDNEITSIQSTDTTEVILIWVNAGADAATSTINSAAMATQNAAAATHTVIVGGSSKVYTPDTIEANVGDMVIFEFHEQNHTATTSAFTSPCVANGVFDTDFMPNPNDTVSPPPQAGMAINVATPIWFYCRQTGHCGEGMTFSINPTLNKTQADFEALAIQQNGTGTASGIVQGGSASASTVSVASGASSTDVAPPASSSDSSSSSGSSSGSSSSGSSSGSSSSGSTGLTTGTGITASGDACTCAVECAVGSIPNIAIQAVNNFGGMGSSIAAANLAH